MYYPVILNLENEVITIIGAGKIAFRKCKSFVDAGIKVNVIGIKILKDFYTLGDGVDILKDEFNIKYIEKSDIVIAATDDIELNRYIGEYCKKNRKLVNVASDLSISNFTIPATIRKDDIIVSVSTGGNSPGMASIIKMQLEESIDEQMKKKIEILGKYRKIIKENEADIKKRKKLNRYLASLDYEKLLRIDGNKINWRNFCEETKKIKGECTDKKFGKRD